MLLFFWLLFSTQPRRSIELTIGYAGEGLTIAPGVNLIDVSLINPNNTPPFIIPAGTEEGEITIEVFPGGVNVDKILDGSIFVSPDSSEIEFSGVVTTPKQTQDLDELLGNSVFTFPGDTEPAGSYFYSIESGSSEYELITGITSKYDIGDCDLCAAEIQEELENLNISGRRIRLTTPGYKAPPFGRIYSDTIQDNAAQNGFHEGVVVELNGREVVFDNIHKNGIPLELWLQDFVGRVPLKLDTVDNW